MSAPAKMLFVESARRAGEAAGEGYTGVYAGSSFCRFALPGVKTVEEIMAAAKGAGISLHLATPVLTEPFIDRTKNLLRAVMAKAPGTEVTINDLGLLSIMKREFPELTPVAGRVLAFQKTDPVIPLILKTAFTGKRGAEAFSHVSVDNPLFAEFMHEMGVKRIEIQAPLHGVNVDSAGFWCSLHTPYVFVSTTMFCAPVERYVKPGRVPGVYHCEKQCFDRIFRLKPHGDDYEFLFRGNTIYYENSEAGKTGLPKNTDRIVHHELPS